MKIRIRFVSAVLLAVLLAAGTASLLGCERDGPAEELGEKIDDAAKKAKDAVD